MKKSRTLIFLPYFIMGYTLMAFVWWAILLYGKNQQVFNAKKEALELRATAGILSESNYKNSKAYQYILEEKKRQNMMVLGEAVVFCLSLSIGMWLIFRAHFREIAAANQQKNFLLSITHELKSPIASIKIVLETLLRRNLTSEQIKKLGTGALSETNRLNELVNDLLLSARLETAYEPEFAIININELVRNKCQSFASVHPELDLSFVPAENIPDLNLDKKGISIILSNLLENAVKYNFSNNKKIHVELAQQNDFLRLQVADNGLGIPDKEKESVLKKFYRSGNEDTRKTKGTGLGLYIVNEIVNSHRGKLAIKNNEPSGTVFLIDLPVPK